MAGDEGRGKALLREAARSGELVNLATARLNDDMHLHDLGAGVSLGVLQSADIRAVLLEPGLVADPRGLQIFGAYIRGALNLDHAKLPCRLVFIQCEFENAPSLEQAHLPGLILRDVRAPGLSLRSTRVAGNCTLSGLRSTGGVDAGNSHVGGQFVLTKAKLTNPNGSALDLRDAEISGGVFLEGLEADGAVQAVSTRIGGQLLLTGATLVNRGGVALTLDGAQISRGAFLEGLEVIGEVRALRADIGGQLILTEARLNNQGGDALTLDGVQINGDAFLTGMEASGATRMHGAYVTGILMLVGAKLANPEGNALTLDKAEITGGAFLSGLKATGEVRTFGALINGQLDLARVNLTNPGREALNLSTATLDTVTMDDSSSIDGRINLSFVTIRVLAVGEKKPPEGLPVLSSAHGWKVGAVHGFLRTDRDTARDWLDTVDALPRRASRKEFEAQPWKELAKVYDQIGQPEDGRRLRFWAAQRTTRVVPWTSKLVRWPYAGLVGYGYYPATIFFWLLGLWVSAFILCSLNAQAFTPTDFRASTITVVNGNQSEEVPATGATPTPSNYPSFSAGLFAMDTALPAAATGQAAAWRITGNAWLPGLFAIFKGFAWALTALLLAGITGLLRKD